MKNNGIYITDNFIRFEKEEVSINAFKKESIPPALRDSHITLGIPRTRVSIKYLSLPTLNEPEIKQMVEYELNNLFPSKPEELVFGYALIQKGPDTCSKVILAVAPREVILKNILTLKQAGLIPDAVNVSTVSLFNQFCLQKRPPANYLLINLDDAFMEIIFVSGQRLEFSRGISFGRTKETGDLIKAIELTVTVLRDKGSLIDKVILSGKGLDLEDFAQGIKQALPYEVEIDHTLDVLKGLVSKGNGDTLKINLLPKELEIQREKIRKRRLSFIFAALLLLNLSLAANIIFLKVKAKQEYLSLLKSEIAKISPGASLLQQKMLNIRIVKEYTNSGRLTLGLLSELYRVAPEGISFGVLDISLKEAPGAMAIAGQAKDSETVYKFANALKGSALIKRADVTDIKKTKPASQEQIVDFEIKTNF